MKRTLRLHSETLTELAPAELLDVVGGDVDMSRVGFTCPRIDCVTELTVLPQCNAWTFSGC